MYEWLYHCLSEAENIVVSIRSLFETFFASLVRPSELLCFSSTFQPSPLISADNQEHFGYLETTNPRHEPCCAGGVSDNARLSEIGKRGILGTCPCLTNSATLQN
jgi:hypothetical protein